MKGGKLLLLDRILILHSKIISIFKTIVSDCLDLIGLDTVLVNAWFLLNTAFNL